MFMKIKLTTENNIEITDVYEDGTEAKTTNLGKIYKTSDDKIYECVENEEKDAYWKQVVMNMYGYWTNKVTGTYLNIKY